MLDNLHSAFISIGSDTIEVLSALSLNTRSFEEGPSAIRWGMLAAPLILLLVRRVGARLVPDGKQLNGAGQVMLTAVALAVAGLVAVVFAGNMGLYGWKYSPIAAQTGELLMTLSLTTGLAGGLLRLRARGGWLVSLAGGGLLALGGALGLKSLEVMAFASNDIGMASTVSPMSHVALGIAALYLLGALFVATRLPRRAAPLSGVLVLLGLVVLATGWSARFPSPWCGKGPSKPLFGQPLLIEDQLTIDDARLWPSYHRHEWAVIEVQSTPQP